MKSARAKDGKSWSASWALLLLLVCSCFGADRIYARNAESAARRELRQAADIRKLSVAEANRNYPVRLKAVVTYYDPQGPDLFIQDQTAGIWVNVEGTKLNVPVSAGDLVEVTGVTEQPDFAPEVGKPHFTLLGRAPLPKPKRVTYQAMASTMEDSVRVEVEGIVHRVWKDDEVLLLDVAVDGGRVLARIPFYKQEAPQSLVSERVRLRGTCGADFNSNYQLVGVDVHVPNLPGLTILEPALADRIPDTTEGHPGCAAIQPRGNTGTPGAGAWSSRDVSRGEVNIY